MSIKKYSAPEYSGFETDPLILWGIDNVVKKDFPDDAGLLVEKSECWNYWQRGFYSDNLWAYADPLFFELTRLLEQTKIAETEQWEHGYVLYWGKHSYLFYDAIARCIVSSEESLFDIREGA